MLAARRGGLALYAAAHLLGASLARRRVKHIPLPTSCRHTRLRRPATRLSSTYYVHTGDPAGVTRSLPYFY
jgi:hypothetical protein